MITPEQLSNPNDEASEQKALFCWAALNCGQIPELKFLFAIPNGGSRHIAEASSLVAQGVKRGVPDICLPVPIQKGWGEMYAGLYIELKIEKRRKTKNGGCSDEQIEWLEFLAKMGYQTNVCYGWIEARDKILEYLKNV